jgi:stage II sporulation protein M
VFTFGVGGLILTPAVYVILGYIVSQVIIAGQGLDLVAASVLPHGIIEIPVIVLAAAASFKLGAVITRPPDGLTVGQAWTRTLGDTFKIAIGLVIPGLILAALIESFITPLIVLWTLGG